MPKTFKTKFSIEPKVTFENEDLIFHYVSEGEYTEYMHTFTSLEDFVDNFLYVFLVTDARYEEIEGKYKGVKFIEGFGKFVRQDCLNIWKLIDKDILPLTGDITLDIPNNGYVDVEWPAEEV